MDPSRKLLRNVWRGLAIPTKWSYDKTGTVYNEYCRNSCFVGNPLNGIQYNLNVQLLLVLNPAVTYPKRIIFCVNRHQRGTQEFRNCFLPFFLPLTLAFVAGLAEPAGRCDATLPKEAFDERHSNDTDAHPMMMTGFSEREEVLDEIKAALANGGELVKHALQQLV